VLGLSEAARVLLNIWDALQKVDVGQFRFTSLSMSVIFSRRFKSNRMACLRLTERCADILVSVREEIRDAGDHVTEELKEPIGKLAELRLGPPFLSPKLPN
jgi:abelson tyrosine-protein kinase 1